MFCHNAHDFPALCEPCTIATTATASCGLINIRTTGVSIVDNPKPAGTVRAAATNDAIIAIPIISWPGNTFKFVKHALEWDYFLGVITFYLLTFFMWKKKIN